jgi:hypothetical protein
MAVVAAFVHRIVAGLAEDYAVEHIAGPADRRMFHVMGLANLAAPVIYAPSSTRGAG